LEELLSGLLTAGDWRRKSLYSSLDMYLSIVGTMYDILDSLTGRFNQIEKEESCREPTKRQNSAANGYYELYQAGADTARGIDTSLLQK